MTIKVCPSCKSLITSKNCVKKGRNEMGLHFNCTAILADGKKCDSTVLLRVKNWKELILKGAA